MSYKDIEKKRASWRKWYHNNKNSRVFKFKKIARDKALKIRREKCSVEGCELLGERHHKDYKKPLQIVFLCKKHHEGEHHKYYKCSLCDKPHVALGFCYNHWRQRHRKLYGRTY